MGENINRSNQKRVDESWKDQVSREQGVPEETAAATSNTSFSNFITSLGIQALIRLGELKTSESEELRIDLDQARETIDLLLMVKDKTKGNLSAEEENLLTSLIADLQMRFVQHRKP